MKRSTILFSLIWMSSLAFSQQDSLKRTILEAGESPEVLILNGRNLIDKNFHEGNLETAMEIHDYLKESVADTLYIAFFPSESWMLSYWTNNYTLIFHDLEKEDSVKNRLNNAVWQPTSRALHNTLVNKTSIHLHELVDSVRKYAGSAEERDFLILLLHNLVMNQGNKTIGLDDVNLLADHFLATYPESKFENLVRNQIRIKWKASDWGLGCEFFSGYGTHTSALSTYFKNSIPIGVAFDIYYKDFVLYLRDYIGFSNTRIPISNEQVTWGTKSQVRVFIPEATIGYQVVNHRRFSLTPFAGIGSIDIGPTEHDKDKMPDLEDLELCFTTAWIAGLNLDIKFGNPGMSMVSNGPEQRNFFARIRYGYCAVNFENKYPGFTGNIHYITLGLGGFGRSIKRDL